MSPRDDNNTRSGDADVNNTCPCGSGVSYKHCCGLFHGGAIPATPEQLMRSRYSAFALGMVDYLKQTWHPSTQPNLQLNDNPQWIKLEILESWQHGEKGFVHFRAFYKVGDELGMLAEKSDFVFENNRWYYVTGDY